MSHLNPDSFGGLQHILGLSENITYTVDIFWEEGIQDYVGRLKPSNKSRTDETGREIWSEYEESLSNGYYDHDYQGSVSVEFPSISWGNQQERNQDIEFIFRMGTYIQRLWVADVPQRSDR